MAVINALKRLCCLAVGVPNPCVYMHEYERPCTHIKDPVVHVRVWWIMHLWKHNNNQHACGTAEDRIWLPKWRRN